MNILFVSKHYYPAMGGVETQLRLLANEFAHHHEVEVATLFLRIRYAGAEVAIERMNLKNLLKKIGIWTLLRKVKNSLFLPKFKSYVDGAVPVHVLKLSMLDRLRILPVANNDDITRSNYLRAYRAAYVAQLRPLIRGKDVVHCLTDGYLGWAAEEAARAEGVPFVLTPYVHPGDHGEDADNVAYYQRAARVFALLETGAEKLAELGVSPERLRLSGVVPLLPEKVDPDGFRAAHGLEAKPIVLFVGRMTEYKGPLAILEAAQHVWRDMPDVHFLFAGPAGREQMRWFTSRPDERIRYLGQVTEQEKGDALAACDLFCMPSLNEILPAVYLEAWSYAKPVIGGTAHGLRELIEGHDAGVIVRQDPPAIAAQILALLRDEPRRRRMGEQGRALVERRFTTRALVQALEQSYGEVAAAHKAAARHVPGRQEPRLSVAAAKSLAS